MQIRVVMLPAGDPVKFRSGERIVGETSGAQGVIEAIDIAPNADTFLTTTMMTAAEFQAEETVRIADNSGRSARVTAIGIPGKSGD